jgi:hypothetical protein
MSDHETLTRATGISVTKPAQLSARAAAAGAVVPEAAAVAAEAALDGAAVGDDVGGAGQAADAVAPAFAAGTVGAAAAAARGCGSTAEEEDNREEDTPAEFRIVTLGHPTKQAFGREAELDSGVALTRFVLEVMKLAGSNVSAQHYS